MSPDKKLMSLTDQYRMVIGNLNKLKREAIRIEHTQLASLATQSEKGLQGIIDIFEAHLMSKGVLVKVPVETIKPMFTLINGGNNHVQEIRHVASLKIVPRKDY